MPSNWEFCEACTLFHLSFHEASSESWQKIDNAVILHHSHLHGSRLYLNDQQLTSFYCATCPEHLFLHLVDLPEFHVDDLDTLCTLVSNHIDCIQHEDATSQTMPCPGTSHPSDCSPHSLTSAKAKREHMKVPFTFLPLSCSCQGPTFSCGPQVRQFRKEGEELREKMRKGEKQKRGLGLGILDG